MRWAKNIYCSNKKYLFQIRALGCERRGFAVQLRPAEHLPADDQSGQQRQLGVGAVRVRHLHQLSENLQRLPMTRWAYTRTNNCTLALAAAPAPQVCPAPAPALLAHPRHLHHATVQPEVTQPHQLHPGQVGGVFKSLATCLFKHWKATIIESFQHFGKYFSLHFPSVQASSGWQTKSAFWPHGRWQAEHPRSGHLSRSEIILEKKCKVYFQCS